VEQGKYLRWVDRPDGPPDVLKLGLTALHFQWDKGLTPDEKKKAMRDILDSGKGYEKTARTAFDWDPPRLVNLTEYLKNWLDLPSNDNVFTGVAGNETTSVRAQFKAGYRTANPERRQYLWDKIFAEISGVLGLSGDRGALKAVLGTHAVLIRAALDPVIDPAEVTDRLKSFRTAEPEAPEAPAASAEPVLELVPGNFNQFDQFRDFRVHAQLTRAMAPVLPANLDGDPKPRTDAEMAQILVGKFGSEFTPIKDHARHRFNRVSNAKFVFDLVR